MDSAALHDSIQLQVLEKAVVSSTTKPGASGGETSGEQAQYHRLPLALDQRPHRDTHDMPVSLDAPTPPPLWRVIAARLNLPPVATLAATLEWFPWPSRSDAQPLYMSLDDFREWTERPLTGIGNAFVVDLRWLRSHKQPFYHQFQLYTVALPTSNGSELFHLRIDRLGYLNSRHAKQVVSIQRAARRATDKEIEVGLDVATIFSFQLRLDAPVVPTLRDVAGYLHHVDCVAPRYLLLTTNCYFHSRMLTFVLALAPMWERCWTVTSPRKEDGTERTVEDVREVMLSHLLSGRLLQAHISLLYHYIRWLVPIFFTFSLALTLPFVVRGVIRLRIDNKAAAFGVAIVFLLPVLIFSFLVIPLIVNVVVSTLAPRLERDMLRHTNTVWRRLRLPIIEVPQNSFEDFDALQYPLPGDAAITMRRSLYDRIFIYLSDDMLDWMQSRTTVLPIVKLLDALPDMLTCTSRPAGLVIHCPPSLHTVAPNDQGLPGEHMWLSTFVNDSAAFSAATLKSCTWAHSGALKEPGGTFYLILELDNSAITMAPAAIWIDFVLDSHFLAVPQRWEWSIADAGILQAPRVLGITVMRMRPGATTPTLGDTLTWILVALRHVPVLPGTALSGARVPPWRHDWWTFRRTACAMFVSALVRRHPEMWDLEIDAFPRRTQFFGAHHQTSAAHPLLRALHPPIGPARWMLTSMEAGISWLAATLMIFLLNIAFVAQSQGRFAHLLHRFKTPYIILTAAAIGPCLCYPTFGGWRQMKLKRAFAAFEADIRISR